MIYIHFPFCKSFCTYCDFYSVRGKDRIAQYTQSLLREISLERRWRRSLRRSGRGRRTTDVLAVLYVGGGTPSLWPVEQLGEAVAVVSAVLREGAAELSREHGMVGMPGSSRNLPSRSIRMMSRRPTPWPCGGSE